MVKKVRTITLKSLKTAKRRGYFVKRKTALKPKYEKLYLSLEHTPADSELKTSTDMADITVPLIPELQYSKKTAKKSRRKTFKYRLLARKKKLQKNLTRIRVLELSRSISPYLVTGKVHAINFRDKTVTFFKVAKEEIGSWKVTPILLRWLHPWKYHKRLTITFSFFFLIFGTFFYFYILKDLPNPATLTVSHSPQSTIIRDRNGEILYRIYKDANRTWLTWDEIPAIVKKATISIEDANFAYHYGVEPKAIIRAFIRNLGEKNANLYQGGSTITQQLVKNVLLSSEKTYKRKAREITLAIWTELIFSKKEILTMYLNEVGYGGPAYGIEAASQMYFDKPAKNLTLAQAAFLAGLPAAPTTFSPFGSNPQLADVRKEQVLERMLKLKMIGKDEYDKALSEKLALAPQRIEIQAPHFVMFMKNQLVDKFGEGVIEGGGLDVTTTLDLSIQRKAEEIVKKNIAEIKDKYNIHNAAVLVTSPQNGEILAMVGSPDYFDIENKGYVNGTTSPRQPGSSIKPVNYGYAFDHGWTPNSIIEDSPVVYTAKGSTEVYAPKNYDGRFHGTVTLRSALANSYNVPAVKILNSYGVGKMVETGLAMGIKSWNPAPNAGLSLTLGGAEVTMLDMARAYGTIANLGVKKELRPIKEIRDNNRNDITELFYKDDKGIAGINVNAQESKQAISQISAYWITDILADNVARLPAFGPYAKLTVPNHKVAVKTGTSNDFRDNWTMGFTPDYLTVVWVGNNDGSYMNKNLVSGITGAAPIWNDVMTNLIADKPDKEFPKPQGMVAVKICAVNGLLTCPNCPQEKTEYFPADKVPTKQCYFKSTKECDEVKKQLEGKSDEEKKKMLTGCN
jgi:1A family penicillin-binding protein